MNSQEFKVGDRVKVKDYNILGTIIESETVSNGMTFYKVEYDEQDEYGDTYGDYLCNEMDIYQDNSDNLVDRVNIDDILEIANRNLNMLKYGQPATKQFSEQEVIDYIYDVITKRI